MKDNLSGGIEYPEGNRRLEELALIATVRLVLLWVEVTTAYRPRTDVERWQIQDRLTARLRHLGFDAPPRFYDGPGGRLAFRVRVGWRPPPDLLPGLQRIDDAAPMAG